MTMRKKAIVAAVAVVVLAAGGGAAWWFTQGPGAQKGGNSAESAKKDGAVDKPKDGASEQKGPLLEFMPADIGQASVRAVGQYAEGSGALQAERSVTVRSKQGAEVRDITVREGETVQRGQVLVTLDVRELQERVRAAEGSLAAVDARVANAKRTRDAQKSLVDQNFISANAFDSAESAYQASLGEATSARAQVALARQALGETVVRAPMGGVVAKRYVQPGEKLGFDSPVVQIVDPSSLELQAFVAPELAARVRVGQSAQVKVSGFGEAIDAKLVRVMPAVDNATRQLGVVLRIGNTNASLKVGMEAQARIELGSAQLLSVPLNSLHSANGEPYVWELGADNKVQRRKLVLGARDDVAGTVAVTSGIAASARVLLGRYDGLNEGQLVSLKSQAAVKAASTASTPASAPASAPKKSV
jgi:membrane fusion protein, multidrug efflux system